MFESCQTRKCVGNVAAFSAVRDKIWGRATKQESKFSPFKSETEDPGIGSNRSVTKDCIAKLRCRGKWMLCLKLVVFYLKT